MVRGLGWCGAGKGGDERVDNQVVRDKKIVVSIFFCIFARY